MFDGRDEPRDSDSDWLRMMEHSTSEPRYQVRLASGNEGVEYRDEEGVFRFNVELVGRDCILFLPGSKGDTYQQHELTPEEEERILPRITRYLSRVWWLGIFPRSYSVVVRRHVRAGTPTKA